MTTPKWDVKTESFEGFSFNARTGKSKAATGTRVRYRRVGSRGRFKTFVVEGAMPKNVQLLVSKYEDRNRI